MQVTDSDLGKLADGFSSITIGVGGTDVSGKVYVDFIHIKDSAAVFKRTTSFFDPDG